MKLIQLIYTLKILKKIKEKKEFLIIYSKILTSKTNLAKLNKLKKMIILLKFINR